MKKGWRKTNSKVIHQNPWYKVREDDVVRPNGSNGKYFVVEGADSVAVIAKDENNLFYLVEQSRYSIGNIYSRELITGGIKTGLTPLEGAKLELSEEAGIIAKKWQSLGYFYPFNGYLTEKCHVFLATGLSIGKSNPEDTENINVVKLSRKEIIDQIKNNIIHDGISISAFYKYLLYSKKESK